ncbi:MAG: type III pantothenate kinase [Ruminococcaceae bacterium]|nr:type III pantothenate kinase [Oscillospiraceae bacterium]
MILAIDVGNTNIVVALFDGDKLKNSWRISTDKNKTSDEIGITLCQLTEHSGIKAEQIEDVIISSVVPPIMHSLCNAIRKYIKCEPMVVGPGVKTGLNIKYDNPKEVGADRIVNAVGAIHKYGKPLILVDFGTATTFCAIDKNGDYLGGVIAPGVKVSMSALFERAAKLPRVEIKKPRSAIGKNTVSSMQSGAVYGQAGQVDRIVDEIKKELNEENVKVIATGGLSVLIAPESNCIDIVDKTLTLDGLRIIYDMNK